MAQVNVHVENGVTMAYDTGVAAWVFDLDQWGSCGQGRTEAHALEELKAILPGGAELRVVERIHGDESAFERDRVPAADDEVERTLTILSSARVELLDLVRKATEDDLDRAVTQEASFASWSTVRERVWHIADTESRYYLPALGLPSRPRSQDLISELQESTDHVRKVLRGLPRDLCWEEAGEVWTSTKLLRRLAWHEPGELVAIREALETDLQSA